MNSNKCIFQIYWIHFLLWNITKDDKSTFSICIYESVSGVFVGARFVSLAYRSVRMAYASARGSDL